MATSLTVTDGHFSRLTIAACEEFLPDLMEDENRVREHDSLQDFMPLDEISADSRQTPWDKGMWVRHARPR